MVWANPIPVAVALVPIVDGDRTGLLVVRRGIAPVGKLALVGGFVEEHERWQDALAREVREEVGVIVDAASIALQEAVSTEPKPNRILMFATTAPIAASSLPPFTANHESLARGVIYGPDRLEDEFAWALHIAAARRWFALHGVTGPNGHRER